MLVGTDYNDKVPRVGQRTALKLIKEFGSLEDLIKDGKYEIVFPYEEIRDIFLNPPKDDIGSIDWGRAPDVDEVVKILERLAALRQ